MQQHLTIAKSKLKIIGKGSSNGIDTLYFNRTAALERSALELRARHGIREVDHVFSFVGRIVRDKGIVELVKGFKELSDTEEMFGRRIILLLVGHFEEDLDPLPPDVLEFLMKDNRVILAGFQADVRPWIIASDVFVFPSYREGFPNVVMQASVLGVPCIVSDINGCNEIVSHNVTVFVVPPKNIVALVQAMKIMINDAVKRKHLGEAARDFVTGNFKRELIWEELRNEYTRLMINKKKLNSTMHLQEPFLV